MVTYSPAITGLLRGAEPVGGRGALIPLHFSGKHEEIASPPLDMNRKIAAILAADVAGYSRLVAADEEGALRRLVDAQGVFKDRVAAYRGRIFNTAGDAILAEFPSAVDATRAALDIQRAMADRNAEIAAGDRFLFRIGLNIGDVVEHEGDLLGDGVNVAARLQTLAPAGGLAISHWVREHTAGKITLPVRDIGKKSLKNIPAPIQVFVADLAPTTVSAPVSDGAASSPIGPQLKLALAVALILALGAAAFMQFRTSAPSPAAPPPTETAKQPAPLSPPVVEPTKAAAPAPTPPVSVSAPITKQPEAQQEPKQTLPSVSPQPPAITSPVPPTVPVSPQPAAVPPAPVIEAARPPSPPPEKSIVSPPVITAQPAASAPAKAEKEAAAPAKRPQMTCAEVLERAQLGDITADDRAFLRNQCR